MEEASKLFDHIFIDNHAERTLFLLHGTGGSREDFLFLNDALKKKYNLVGIQGNVDEHGLSRFFKRLSVGVFDQKNIREETEKLQRFMNAWRIIHKTKA